MFTWKRPFELSSNASLYVDGTSRRDVIQGILGDCWLLSTCAAIAKREDLMHRVLSPNQVLFQLNCQFIRCIDYIVCQMYVRAVFVYIVLFHF